MLHDRLEARAFGAAIRQRRLSPGQYEHLLTWQYRTHRLLEATYDLASFRWEAYTYQSRLPALQADLERHFPRRARQLLAEPQPVAVVPPTTAACLGCCYVLEGAALGGQLIYRALRETPDLTALHPFRFYEFQRKTGRIQWKSFTAVARQFAGSAADRREAAESAASAFLLFERQLTLSQEP